MNETPVVEEVSVEQIHEMFKKTEAVLLGLLKAGNASGLDETLMGLIVSVDECAAQARQEGLVLPRTESIYSKLEVAA